MENQQDGNARGRGRGQRRRPRRGRPRIQPEHERDENLDVDGRANDTRAMLDDLIRLVDARERATDQPQNQGHTDFMKLHQVFVRMNSPQFDGSGGYAAAEAWMEGVREKLQYCRAPEENWVSLATQLLESHAQYWWAARRRLYPHGEQEVTWTWFEKEFRDRYMGQAQLEVLRRKFLDLKQAGRSVADYHEQFYSLLRYAPDVSDDPERLCRQYVEGLDPELAVSVDLVMTRDLNSLMQQALRTERHMERAGLRRHGMNRNQRAGSVSGIGRAGQEGMRRSTPGIELLKFLKMKA